MPKLYQFLRRTMRISAMVCMIRTLVEKCDATPLLPDLLKEALWQKLDLDCSSSSTTTTCCCPNFATFASVMRQDASECSVEATTIP